MASRFWVGGTGTWDNVSTTHWASTSGGASGASVPGSGDTVTLDASSGGGTVTINFDINVTSITMGAFTGTLDFGATNPTLQTFSNTGSGTRTLTMGSGTWTITGSGTTLVNMSTLTNLTITPTTCTWNFTYSGGVGTRTVNCGNATGQLVGNISISAGTDTFNLTNTSALNIDWTGFSGIMGTGTHSCSGNYTLSSTMTCAASGFILNLLATTGTQVIKSNGVSWTRDFTINAGGATIQLFDALTTSGQFSLQAGTLDFNTKAVSCKAVIVSGGATKVFTITNSTVTLTGTGTVWNLSSVPTTLNSSGSTVKLTDASATGKTFDGGGKTYNNFWITGAGTGSYTIAHDNTFNDFKDDNTVAHSILFTAGITTTVTTFSVSGNGAGNEITINSTTTGTHTLTAPSKNNASPISCDYLNIQHSITTEANTWYAGTHSVNNQATATAGSGWIFTAPALVSSSNGGFFRLL